MLEFSAGVSCLVFHHQAAAILHHASTWAAIGNVTVLVLRIGEPPDDATVAARDEQYVDLGTAGDPDRELPPLRGYLTRVLDEDFVAVLEGDRLHVTWGSFLDVH